jgi:hypothetical protein
MLMPTSMPDLIKILWEVDETKRLAWQPGFLIMYVVYMLYIESNVPFTGRGGQ